MKFLRNVLAAVGLLAIVIGAVGCKVLVDYLQDFNQVPGIIEEAAATLEAIGHSEPGSIIIRSDPATVPSPIPQFVTATPPPPAAVVFEAPPPTPTATPEPTRPAIERLPLGEGPYTAEQFQICRDVWAQSRQAELNIKQFGYCQGVVERDGG